MLRLVLFALLLLSPFWLSAGGVPAEVAVWEKGFDGVCGRVPGSADKKNTKPSQKRQRPARSQAPQGIGTLAVVSIVLAGLGLFFTLTLSPLFLAFAFWTGWRSLLFFILPFLLCLVGAALGGMFLQRQSENPDGARGKRAALVGLILGLVGALLILLLALLFLTFL